MNKKVYRLLHNIGMERHSNYNTWKDISECQDILTFDGVYRNVWEERHMLKDRECIFFVMGDYIGKDNTFDLSNVPKLEKYCSLGELGELSSDPKHELGWHTYSHPDLTTLTKEEIMREIMPPFPMKSFAMPYGRYNDLVIECIKEAGYECAFSVNQTDGTQWTIPRPYLNH